MWINGLTQKVNGNSAASGKQERITLYNGVKVNDDGKDCFEMNLIPFFFIRSSLSTFYRFRYSRSIVHLRGLLKSYNLTKAKSFFFFCVWSEGRKTRMTDWVVRGLGSIGGALVSEALKLVIEEAKKYKSFKPLSKDLVSTMERLLPLTKKIDSMQNELDLGSGELKQLRETIEKARVLVLKFPSVRFYEKSNYTRKIVEINEDLAKFCDIDLQLLQYRNQLTLLGVAGNLVDKVDGLSKRMDGLMSVPVPVFRDLCSVPKLDKVVVGLDWPLMELKKRLLDDVVVNLVVSAPPGCGKTTLATQLCHDADVIGKEILKVSIFTHRLNVQEIARRHFI